MTLQQVYVLFSRISSYPKKTQEKRYLTYHNLSTVAMYVISPELPTLTIIILSRPLALQPYL